MRLGLCLALLLAVAAPVRAADDVNEANERATKAAAAAAAPWVVKIETAGGRATIGAGQQGVRKGTGPTTGVVVDPDGYVISSAFNFANKPTDIFVTVPGKPRMVAKVVATDLSRMLTLLKVDLKGLPVPAPFPKADLRIGQWALALGRALDPDVAEVPSVSIGIVSALNRVWGRAVQTDAKISPVNYGGPLVAIDGRPIGVLIPASPQGEGETAGVEWYDSGIGFAVPFEDVLAVVPRLKAGKDLRRGLLGITVQKPDDQYLSPVVIASVSPDSPAAKAGVKPGDTLVMADGKPVANFAQMMHALGPKYDGDVVKIAVTRDGKEQTFENVVLSGAVSAFRVPFLGILPMRDDPEPGVEVRFAYPDGPAAAAKLAPGDRILKLAPAGVDKLAPVPNRAALAGMMTKLAPGAEVQIEVKRKDGKTETVTTRLGTVPEAVPEKLPLPSSKAKAPDKVKAPAGPGKDADAPKPDEAKKGDDAKTDDAPETGLLKRPNKLQGRDYWVYVPVNYDKSVAHGVIVWLHAAGKGGKDTNDMIAIWRAFCEDHNFILVGPQSKKPEGWTASESEEVVQGVKNLIKGYTVDPTRVVAHGMGVGGQMAYYLGFHARDLVRGVAVSGAVLGTAPKDPVPNQPHAFYIVAGEKDPLLKEIAEAKPALEDKKYPVLYRQLADFGKEYLDTRTLAELQSWLDSLDRI